MNNDSTPFSSDTHATTARSRGDSKKRWYKQWWMIVIYSVFALTLINSVSSTEDDDPHEPMTESPPPSTETASPTAEATSLTAEPTSEAPAPEAAEPEPRPEPESEPEPEPEPDPTTESSNRNEGGGSSVHYENCDAARAAGAAPVHSDEPGYGRHLDRDGDGIGCEL